MKERPILFSGPMVRAIQEGRKTQTRRVIKPQAWSYSNDILGQQQIYACSGPDDFGDPDKPIRCPYGQPRDLLWVKETFIQAEEPDEDGNYIVWYKSDYLNDETFGPCKSARYMPKKYARLWLRITNVRVERVQEITEEDAKLEGIEVEWRQATHPKKTYCAGMQSIWDSLNAKRGYSWESNPWVWVLEFGSMKEEVL